MVSSCALLVDEIELTGQKAYVPDFLSALFQESDRVEERDDETLVRYPPMRAYLFGRL